MEIKELLKAIDLETQWLKYYALADSRSKIILNNGISIYDQLVMTGYTKRVIPLDKRCAFLRVTAKYQIDENTPVEDIFESVEYKDNNRNIYTALEYYIITNPLRQSEIYDMLN